MIKTKDEILKAIKDRIGDDTSDETIAFLEDISDTLNDYDNKTKDNTDWKTKYEENDKEWRNKYRDRFFNGDLKEELKNEEIKEQTDGSEGGEDDEHEMTSFDELFTTEKG